VQPAFVSRTLGPEPPTRPEMRSDGTLIVYTAIDGFDTQDVEHEKHTPFRIVSDSGKLLRTVRNQQGSFYQDPTPVTLPPGHHRIDALAANFGPVAIPVVIEARKTTSVYLDGMTRPDSQGRRLSDLVKLPNGRAIGCEARSISSP